MLDILTSLNYDTIFSGGALLISTLVLFVLRSISKKTKTEFDDKIVEAFEEWYKKYKETLPKTGKK